MAPGCVIYPPGQPRPQKTHTDAPPFSFSTTQIRHNPGWSVTAAALPCHASQFVSIIIVLWCHQGSHLKKGGKLFFSSGFRRGNKTCNKGPRYSWAPVWLKDNTRKQSCVVLVTLCVGRNQGYKLPTVTVPGPRLVGVAWDELPQPWSPRVCIVVPLSRRLCQIYAEWPSSQFWHGGKKRETYAKQTRGSHGIALQFHLTWAQRLFYPTEERRKKNLVTTYGRTSVWLCEILPRLWLDSQPTSMTNVRRHSPKVFFVISLFCFVLFL